MDQTTTQENYNRALGLHPEERIYDQMRLAMEQLTPFGREAILAKAVFLNWCHGHAYEGSLLRGVFLCLWGAWEYSLLDPGKFLEHLAMAWKSWTSLKA